MLSDESVRLAAFIVKEIRPDIRKLAKVCLAFFALMLVFFLFAMYVYKNNSSQISAETVGLCCSMFFILAILLLIIRIKGILDSSSSDTSSEEDLWSDFLKYLRFFNSRYNIQSDFKELSQYKKDICECNVGITEKYQKILSLLDTKSHEEHSTYKTVTVNALKLYYENIKCIEEYLETEDAEEADAEMAEGAAYQNKYILQVLDDFIAELTRLNVISDKSLNKIGQLTV